MRWYVDTSVVLHAVLPWGDRRARQWFAAGRARGDEFFSSTLMSLELTRALRREGLDPGLGRPAVSRLNLVKLDDEVLRDAAAIEPHVRSLDAIHLATCALLGDAVQLATHDARMSAVAVELGLEAVDPLAS